MTDKPHDSRRAFRALLWRDALSELFRCGHCQATLTGAIGAGLVTPGEITDVYCPQCKTAWAFKRVPNELLLEPQLTRAQARLPFEPDPLRPIEAPRPTQ